MATWGKGRRSVAARSAHGEHVVVHPGRVPELHRPPEVGRCHGQEVVEPLDVARPSGRQLDEGRPERRPQPADAVEQRAARPHAAVDDGDAMLEHLYLDPQVFRRGIGRVLLDHARAAHDGPLELWAFAENRAGRAFYAACGAEELYETDGRDNEERSNIRPQFEFKQHGRSGAWVSELFPHVATKVDDWFVRCRLTAFDTRAGEALNASNEADRKSVV